VFLAFSRERSMAGSNPEYQLNQSLLGRRAPMGLAMTDLFSVSLIRLEEGRIGCRPAWKLLRYNHPVINN